MKKKIVIKKKFITFFFIYLVLFTSYFSIITLSKYVGITSSSQTATIAKWEVFTDTTENESDTVDIIIGNTTPNYILKITSTSEVKAMYSIVLSNLPSNVEVKLDDRTYQTPINNTISFSNLGYINANANDLDRTITHTLAFKVPIDTNTIIENEIDIDVIFNQENITSN